MLVRTDTGPFVLGKKGIDAAVMRSICCSVNIVLMAMTWAFG